ncbi:MAG TPA: lasso peptide biosynthesis B2 protein [Aliidongia sp.]|uniref:lasso peptide biosynthesis B2 protein n=1 Tax=Aliidongia sp. TaxID=1914230 RepID=UPI002DDDA0F3|nr:lasso peptide biosynthesis B2 protein [Aliidongia sp.]HEV2674715.1 lasso peptide biosynthesis B2 protein [Aliidongia sp.]
MVEAFFCLAAARLGTLVLPFRWVAAFSATPTRRAPLPPEQRVAPIRRIAGVVTVAARHTFFRAACLQQALAVQYMLRRRGVETVLNFGVSHDVGGALAAHAWVTDGDAIVIGGPVGRFPRLAQFPRPDRGP